VLSDQDHTQARTLRLPLHEPRPLDIQTRWGHPRALTCSAGQPSRASLRHRSRTLGISLIKNSKNRAVSSSRAPGTGVDPNTWTTSRLSLAHWCSSVAGRRRKLNEDHQHATRSRRCRPRYAQPMPDAPATPLRWLTSLSRAVINVPTEIRESVGRPLDVRSNAGCDLSSGGWCKDDSHARHT
jgi:hypothetical protein